MIAFKKEFESEPEDKDPDESKRIAHMVAAEVAFVHVAKSIAENAESLCVEVDPGILYPIVMREVITRLATLGFSHSTEWLLMEMEGCAMAVSIHPEGSLESVMEFADLAVSNCPVVFGRTLEEVKGRALAASKKLEDSL